MQSENVPICFSYHIIAIFLITIQDPDGRITFLFCFNIFKGFKIAGAVGIFEIIFLSFRKYAHSNFLILFCQYDIVIIVK